MQMHTEGVEM